MRRPAPPPARASGPVSPPSTETESDSDWAEPIALPIQESADGDPGTPSQGEGAEEEPQTSPPVSGSDLWRAARARRKTLRAEIRRFTGRARRRRLIWLGSAAAVVVLLVGALVAAYSPLFAVRTISVVGAKALDKEELQQALSGQLGTPLALVDDSAVKASLTEFPLVESFAVEARPPHDLVVRIVERTPVGVLDTDAGYTLVDAAGVALSTTEKRPKGQPVLDISGGAGSPAFENAGLVVRALPADLRKKLVKVHAASLDDVTLTFTGSRAVRWGSAERSVDKAAVLERLMKVDSDARSFDVSSPDVPLIG